MSSDLSDECKKTANSKELTIPGTKMVQKMGNKVAKTQKKMQKKMYKSAEKAEKVAKKATGNASAIVETAIHIPRRLSTFGSERPETETCSTQSAKRDVSESSDVDYVTTRTTSFADSVREETGPAAVEGGDSLESQNASTEKRESFASFQELIHNPSVVAVLLAILLSAYKGMASYSTIWDNQVPVHVALTWAVLAVVIGVEIGRRQAAKELREFLSLQSANAKQATALQKHVVEEPYLPRSHPTEHVDSAEQPFPRIRKMMDKVHRHVHSRDWTTLGGDPNRKRQQWERSGNSLVSTSLTKAMRGRTPASCRKSVAECGISKQELHAAKVEDESLFVGETIDDRERMRARSLEDEIVEPLCRLRGMDVFLTDSAQSDLAKHSFLIENGLRDRPTFIINILTQWGNVVMYFEFPEWVISWDEFEEKEDDPEDVIALKRFLNRDDEYRNQRFKVLPVLIDGPGPIKFMAPPRNTVTVVNECLPSAWKKHPAKVNDSGQTILHPCLELECDLMYYRTYRSIAAIVKRYLVSIVGDVGILIEKPYLQKEDEPRACLGMIRFDRIDVKHCPHMPPRREEAEDSEERDIMRASLMVGRPVTKQEGSALLVQTA